MNKTPKLAGYGLHYFATNQLIPMFTDRAIFQCLLDEVRMQLMKSLNNETVLISQERLRLKAGVSNRTTARNSIKRLEELGLITAYRNGYKIHCDEFVTLIKNYEVLPESEKCQFVCDFEHDGISIVQKCTIPVEPMCRAELVGLSGSSIQVESSEMFNYEQIYASESENCSKVNTISNIEQSEICSKVNSFAELLAETVHNCTYIDTECSILNILECSEMNNVEKALVREAILTGKVPETVKNSLENLFTFEHLTCSLLNIFTKKPVQKCTSVIIYNKKKNKRDEPLKNEIQTEEENENFQDNIQKGFEGFGKVEILDLDKPSEEIEEDFKENDDISQLKLKRAERQLRERNSYRNKPFIKVERAKEIVDCLDEVVKSPVDFFIYQFWWGVFDLYCEHYHPSTRINEEGEIEDEPQLSDWKEMIGAALPQDEIYSIAQNVYEDMIGAIEQGKYVYGDDNEWEVSFGFTTFQDFNPYEIFQWSPCTMQDKSVPALKVAIDRFYDIEANDVFTSSKGGKVDKKTKNSQNKKLINLILSADDASLSPMESAIKEFYRDFVVSEDDNIIDEFTDGKGTALESGGGLPDHLLKPWCYNLSSVRYNEFTGVLCNKYKPCDGVHKKAYIFSAENVVEWNERNGYTDTIAHEALQ